jgi:hypothetical protein
MARSPVAGVKETRVASIEMMHAGGQIGFGRLKELMEVVVHQSECEDAPAVRCGGVCQQAYPLVAVVVVQGYVTPFDAAGGDVIDSV